LILLVNESISLLPKFISAQKLLEDKFILEISNDDKNNKKTRRIIELNLGDIACFVKAPSDLCMILLSEVYYQNDIMVLNLQ
jgi:hypothetical protein